MYAGFISFIADGLVVPVVLLAVGSLIYFVANKDKLALYSRMLVAGLTSYMVAKFMGLAYQPSTMRPFELAGVDPGASFLNNPGFPSDHSLFVWVIVFAVWYALPGKRWLVLCLLVLALLVSIGRVLALVHAPIDVIGGFIAAGAGALWYVDTQNILQKDNK